MTFGIKTALVGATMAALAAGPAAALSLEEYFALPVELLATDNGGVFYEEDFDELSAVGDSFDIVFNIGGILTPPLTNAGFSDALAVFIGGDFIGGDVIDLEVGDDYIAALFATDTDETGLAGDYLAVELTFADGTFTPDTFTTALGVVNGGGPQFAFFELSTASEPTNAVPLPAPLALLGFGAVALGAVARRRKA